MFWERASLALPAPLLSALRAGELTDPGGAQRVPRVVCEGALLHTGGEAGGRRRSFFMDYLNKQRHFRGRRFLRLSRRLLCKLATWSIGMILAIVVKRSHCIIRCLVGVGVMRCTCLLAQILFSGRPFPCIRIRIAPLASEGFLWLSDGTNISALLHTWHVRICSGECTECAECGQYWSFR